MLLFSTTLNDKTQPLATDFGLDIGAIDEILLNGILSSFLPPARRRTRVGAVRAQVAALKTKYLPD